MQRFLLILIDEKNTIGIKMYAGRNYTSQQTCDKNVVAYPDNFQEIVGNLKII